MLENPSYWRDYYQGDEPQLRIARFFSYSDRCRYYWHRPEVKLQVDRLIENLGMHPPALTLVSQYLPLEYEAIRAGGLPARPLEMIRHHIRAVLHKYAAACGETRAVGSEVLVSR
jgi:D-tagatose-1,6-bisphosphate aldolase subunit GatZ/KbaZ